MAQTGFTPIQLYSTSTAAAAPSASNLTNSTLGSELAINITDGKLFYKDNANAVQVIGWKVVPATAGGTGQTSYAVGDLLYADTTTSLAKLADVATGNALISGGVGVAPAWGKIGLTTHVTGTLPVTNGGTGTATAFTAGSVVFAGASGVYTQNNANLFWDSSNARLGVGTSSPAQRLDVNGSVNIPDENGYLFGGSGSTTYMTGSKASNYLRWVTNNAERMRIDSSGNVGVGINTPVTRLDVSGGTTTIRSAALFNTSSTAGTGSAAYIRSANAFSSATTPDYTWWFDDQCGIFHPASSTIAFSTVGTERMRIDSSGNVQIGISGTSFPSSNARTVVYTTTVQTGLFVNVDAASSTASSGIAIRKRDNNNTTSQIYVDFQFNQGTSGAGGIQGNGASGVQFYSSSDARLKENVVELDSQLNKILQLQPKIFDFINGAKNCTGFIAQEFKTVYPDAVGEQPDGYLTLGGVSIMETRLIKALQEIVAKLKAAGVTGF
jgi:hypothetical protein